MTLRYRRATQHDAETLRALHVLTFPHDDHEDYLEGSWWLVEDQGEPVAFAGMRPAVTEPHAVYFSRCGVLASHRGRGIQRALVSRRVSAAKRSGVLAAISTTFKTTPSANNLIRAGFRLYDPAEPWAPEGCLYWRKDLT